MTFLDWIQNIEEKYWNGRVVNCTLTIQGQQSTKYERSECPEEHSLRVTVSPVEEVYNVTLVMYTEIGASPPTHWTVYTQIKGYH